VGARHDRRLGCGAVRRLATLVVAGESDPMVSPRRSRELAAAIPDATLEIVSGGGHYVQLEQPAALARAVARFLADLESR
jgi:pimeloyl-ACP methyl ester carboxylesterase